ncbi:transporter [Pulveribacter suum]|uniref:Transporter n=1 Tax=Pulveribacter suum TaxID=2116657 RepID=A0A2P1NH62_9BURK|nr:transporter [Pulveribacter suum]AVP56393.1 transporter [Pulveribacter suum]
MPVCFSPRARWLGAALLGAAGAAQATHPLVTDDTATQGAGHWQLEASTDHTRERAAAGTGWQRATSVTLTHGLADALDVAVTLPWQHWREAGGPPVRGPGDAALLAKWRLLEDEAQGWSLALRPQLTLPSGSQARGLGTGRATAALALIASVQRGPWTWLANAGVTCNCNRSGERKYLWAASTAVQWAATAQWSLVADWGASRAAERAARTDRFALLGAIWHLREDLDLDAGWRRSLGAAAWAPPPGRRRWAPASRCAGEAWRPAGWPLLRPPRRRPASAPRSHRPARARPG